MIKMYYFIESNTTSVEDAVFKTAGCILFVMTPVGITGNGLIILSVIFSNKLRTKTNVFIVTLAATDFLNCATFPAQALFVLGLYVPPSGQLLCVSTGVIAITTLFASMNILVLIALNRWAKIKLLDTKYRLWFNRRNMVVMIILAWIHPLCVAFVPHFAGIVSLGYSHYYRICSWTDDPDGEWYITITVGISIIIAFIVVTFAYTSIGLHVRKRNRQERVAIGAKEIKVTQTLAIVVAVFFFTFMTYVGCTFITGNRVVYTCAASLLIANSIINPFIYALRHPIFSMTLRCILTCRLRNVPHPSRQLRFLLRSRQIGISDFV